jgi:hypothetical protein
MTASVVWWLEFLVTDSEVRVRFPALPDFLRNSGLMTTTEELRERKGIGSCLEIREYGRRDQSR